MISVVTHMVSILYYHADAGFQDTKLNVCMLTFFDVMLSLYIIIDFAVNIYFFTWMNHNIFVSKSIQLYCIDEYCIVLYFIDEYRIKLYCIELNCIELYCIELYCTQSYCIELCCIEWYCIELY